MELSSDQIAIIKFRIEQSGIRIKSLRDDVLDHLCCEIELADGIEFKEALNRAIAELAPKGLQQLEKETMYLLNNEKVIFMKMIIYFIGFVGAVCLAAGTILKLIHMPGADELSTIGLVSFLIVFVPLTAILRYKANPPKAVSEKLKIVLGAASAFVGGVAGIFKVLHLQGFDFLFFSTAILFIAGFLPFLFYTMYKKSIA